MGERVRVVEGAQVALLDDPSVGVDRRHVGPDHADLGMRPQHLDLRLDLPREKRVVRIEQCDELAAHVGEAEVPRRRDPTVPLVNVAHRPAITLDDGAGVVGRAVVDDDDLDVGIALRERALDRGADDSRPVVSGDDHAHQSRDARSFKVSVEWAINLRLRSIAADCRIQLKHVVLTRVRELSPCASARSGDEHREGTFRAIGPPAGAHIHREQCCTAATSALASRCGGATSRAHARPPPPITPAQRAIARNTRWYAPCLEATRRKEGHPSPPLAANGAS